MNKSVTSVLLALILSLSMLIGMANAGENAQAKIAVDLNPSTSDTVETTRQAALGGVIDVDIVAQDVSNLDSFDLKLLYNPFKLKVNPGTVVAGPFLNSQVNGDSFFKVDLTQPGRIGISNSLPGQDSGAAPDGAGVIAKAQFTVIGGGAIDLTFSDVLFFNHLREKDNITANAQTSIITGPSLTNQKLTADLNPVTQTVETTVQASLDAVINVDIIAADVVNLDSFDITILYDRFKLKLNPGTVTAGPFLNPQANGESFFQVESSNPGTLIVSNSLPGQNPEDAPDGTGVIAKAQFTVVGGGDD